MKGTEGRYKLIGSTASPYALKLRALMRYRRIAFDWVIMTKALRKQTEHLRNKPLLEESYRRILAAFEPHVGMARYLLGSRPSLADFAWFGQLSEMATDPTPMRIMRESAPFTEHWVRRLDDASGVEGRWYPREQALDGWVEALLRIVGELYLPFLIANADAFTRGLERLQINVWGLPYVLAPFKYQVKCLQQLRGKLAELDAADRAALQPILRRTGCWEFLAEP
jgi:Glutathione S-transferase, C-terminal domain